MPATGLCLTCRHERGDHCAQAHLAGGHLWREGGVTVLVLQTNHGVRERRVETRCPRYADKESDAS